MTTDIVEVLVKILKGLGDDNSLEEMNKSLSADKGLSKQMLSTAFSLMLDKQLAKKSKKNISGSENIRFLNDDEKYHLGSENYEYLMRLMNIGLIDNFTLDLILEQTLLFPTTKISKEEINWIVLMSLVDFEKDILPGSRYILFSSDNIN